MVIALVVLTLGEIALLLDLANRLLGSYVRTPAGVFTRISIVVLACVLLAMPACLLLLDYESDSRRYVFYGSSLIGLVIFVHYLFPYRFGISRIRQARSTKDQKVLVPNLLVRSESVRVPSLSAGRDALQFLVVSDLHCNTHEKLDLIKGAFAELSNDMFDAVLVLGDLSENGRILPQLISAIADLPSRHGTFLVRGNHDFEEGRDVLIEDLAGRHSIKILSNTSSHIPELGVRLVGFEYPPAHAQLPPKSECPMTLGLTHTPDNIILFSRLGVDIVVAGHTHGGWFALPVLGPLLIPSRLGRFLNEGWFKRGRTIMYVTTGLPYFADYHGRPGEILKLTVRPTEATEGTAHVR